MNFPCDVCWCGWVSKKPRTHVAIFRCAVVFCRPDTLSTIARPMYPTCCNISPTTMHCTLPNASGTRLSSDDVTPSPACSPRRAPLNTTNTVDSRRPLGTPGASGVSPLEASPQPPWSRERRKPQRRVSVAGGVLAGPGARGCSPRATAGSRGSARGVLGSHDLVLGKEETAHEPRAGFRSALVRVHREGLGFGPFEAGRGE